MTQETRILYTTEDGPLALCRPHYEARKGYGDTPIAVQTTEDACEDCSWNAYLDRSLAERKREDAEDALGVFLGDAPSHYDRQTTDIVIAALQEYIERRTSSGRESQQGE